MASAAAYDFRFRLLPAVARCACLRLACGVVAALVVAPHSAIAASAQGVPAGGAAARSLTKLSEVQTLEEHNKTLAAARLRAMAAPTVENQRALGEEYAKAGVLDAALITRRSAPPDPTMCRRSTVGTHLARVGLRRPGASAGISRQPGAGFAGGSQHAGHAAAQAYELDAAREQFDQARRWHLSRVSREQSLLRGAASRELGGRSPVVPRSGGDGPSIAHRPEQPRSGPCRVRRRVEGALSAFESARHLPLPPGNQGMVLAAAGRFDRRARAFGLARRPTRRSYRPRPPEAAGGERRSADRVCLGRRSAAGRAKDARGHGLRRNSSTRSPAHDAPTGAQTGSELAYRLGVTFAVIEPLVELLKRDRLCEIAVGRLPRVACTA